MADRPKTTRPDPTGTRSNGAHGHPTRVLALPAPDAPRHGRPRPARPGGRVRRLQRHCGDGPPRPTGRRVLADVRGHDDQRVGGGTHLGPSGRLPRPLRFLPAPGDAGAGGPDDRPCVGRPLRARHRLGLGDRRVRGLWHRFDRAQVPRQPPPGVPRDHDGALARRAVRLRGRALHAAGGATAADPDHTDPHRHRRRRPQDDGARRHLRRLVERAREHPRPLRRDAGAGRAGAVLAAGPGGVRRSRRGPRRGGRNRPAPLLGRARARGRARAGRLLRLAGRPRRRAGLRLVHRLCAARDARGVRPSGDRTAGGSARAR